jgi:ribonuclease-3
MLKDGKKQMQGKLNRNALLSQLETMIGYRFRDRRLLFEALTHRSYASRRSRAEIRDNERMEFFGDAVVGFAISKMLLNLFPESDEGLLSRIRASVVGTDTLASLAEGIGLGSCLFLGSGEEKTGGRSKKSVLANSFEALAAAVYLDGGVASVEKFIERYFGPLLDAHEQRDDGRDYKTKLQELSHAMGCNPPCYLVDDVSGPDHDLMFKVTVIVGDDCFGRGTGKTRKEAEQCAAREGLALLREEQRRLT